MSFAFLNFPNLIDDVIAAQIQVDGREAKRVDHILSIEKMTELPSLRSQGRNSSLPRRAERAVGDTVTVLMWAVWPMRFFSTLRGLRDQTLTTLSQPAETKVCLRSSGEKRTQ